MRQCGEGRPHAPAVPGALGPWRSSSEQKDVDQPHTCSSGSTEALGSATQQRAQSGNLLPWGEGSGLEGGGEEDCERVWTKGGLSCYSWGPSCHLAGEGCHLPVFSLPQPSLEE